MIKISKYIQSRFAANTLGDLIFRAVKTRSLVLFATMISSIITYRYFSPESRGYLSLLTSLVAALTACSFTVEAHLQKEVGRLQNGATASLVLAAHLIRLLTCTVAVIIFAFIGNLNFEIFGLTDLDHIYLIAFVTLLSMIISPHNEVVLLGAGNFGAADKFYTLRFVSIIFTLSLFLFWDINIYLYFTVLICSQTALFSLHTWSQTKKYFGTIYFAFNRILTVKSSEIFSFIKEGWPIWFMTLLHTASATLALVCISMYLGFSDVAGYTLLFSLTSMIFTFPNRLEDYFYTFLAKFKSQSDLLFSKMFLLYQELYVAICAIPMLIWLASAPIIIPLVFGETYNDYSQLSYFFSIFFLIKSLSFVRRVFYINNVSHELLKLAVIKYFFEYAGYIFLTPIFGLDGVLWSLILAQTLFTILMYKNAMPYLRVSPKYLKQLILTFIVFCIFVILVYLCEENDLLFGYWMFLITSILFYSFKLHQKNNQQNETVSSYTNK